MKGDKTVITNLQAGLVVETSLQLQLHLDVRFLKDMELGPIADKIDHWGEGSECIVKLISNRLILFRVDPAYDGIAAPVAVNKSLTALLKNELDLEQAAFTAYEGYCTQARSVGDESTAHDWKDYLHKHEKRIGRIEQWLRQIEAYGENQFALEMMD